MSLIVEYCGEEMTVSAGDSFVIGRDADLVVDDNPFLHRHFLLLSEIEGLWTVTNVGDQLAATVSDGAGRLEAHLAPGAFLPLAFEHTVVRFTAGPTSYELSVRNGSSPFRSQPVTDRSHADGATTVGRVSLTRDQELLVVALAESALRSAGAAASVIPTSAVAARRLGWTVTKFNRKLDNVCEKLAKLGVRGLRGDVASLASNRRARLVEYALAVRLVTPESLALLDALPKRGAER